MARCIRRCRTGVSRAAAAATSNACRSLTRVESKHTRWCVKICALGRKPLTAAKLADCERLADTEIERDRRVVVQLPGNESPPQSEVAEMAIGEIRRSGESRENRRPRERDRLGCRLVVEESREAVVAGVQGRRSGESRDWRKRRDQRFDADRHDSARPLHPAHHLLI